MVLKMKVFLYTIAAGLMIMAFFALPSPAGAQQEALMKKQTEGIKEFVKRNMELFDRRLEQKKARVRELNCPLPVVSGLPQGRRIIIKVRRPGIPDADKDGLKPWPKGPSKVKFAVANKFDLRSSMGKYLGEGKGWEWVVAGDQVTADLMGLPRHIRFKGYIEILRLEEEDCSGDLYDERLGRRRAFKGKRIKVIDTQKVNIFGSPSVKGAIPDLKIGVESHLGGYKYIGNGVLETRNALGRDKVKVSIESKSGAPWYTSRFDRFTSCKEKGGGIDELIPIKLTAELSSGLPPAVQIIGFNLKVQAPLDGVAFQPGNVNVFFSEKGGSGGGQVIAKVTPRVTLANGSSEIETHVANPENLGISSSGGPFRLDSYTLKVIHEGGVGKSKFTVGPPAMGGKHHLSRDLTVTANQYHLTIEPSPRLGVTRTGHRYPVLETHRSYKMRLVVRGPADMSRYRVKWFRHKAQGLGEESKPIITPESSAFQRKAGIWVAESEMKLPGDVYSKLIQKSLTALGQFGVGYNAVEVGGTITTAKGKGVGFAKIELVPATPALKGMVLNTDTEDLFFSSTSVGKLPLDRLSVDMTFGEGDSGFTVKDVPILRYLRGFQKWFVLQADKTNLIRAHVKPGVNEIETTGKATGRAGLRVVADAEGAWKGGAILLPPGKASLASEPLTFRVNQLFLHKSSTSTSAYHVLSVMGPSPMKPYKVRWHFTRGNPVAGRFQHEAEGWSARRRLISGKQLRKVEVLDAEMNVIATLLASAQYPAITLMLPLALTQDEETAISATISDLPRSLWPRTVCRWDIDPEFGNFVSRKETPVVMENEQKGNCQAILYLKEKRLTPGKSPSLRVRLMLKEGR